ncbi:helix-turn-helix domain-containing protein [Streptomyces sp. NPDC057638]|uniref:AraC-like ligand-binding domain-containing protein n=1 Tax=Streptomyces sp. NPDC057638 TaxID=3346190 RepID=UPI00368A88F2
MSTPTTAQPLPSITYNSLDADPADRFGYWCDLMGSTHAPLELRSEHADDFRVRQQVISLGDVVVWPIAFPAVTMRRTPRLIRQSDPESYHLTLMLRGHGVVTRRDHEVHYDPGHFHSQDTSRPLDIQASSARGRLLTIGIEVPKPALPLPRRLADRAIGLPMPDGHGVGALMAQFLRQFVRNRAEYRATDAPRLGAVATDLMAAVFARAVEAENALPPHTRHSTTLLRIKAFIQRNLADPALTPAAVAAAHHISTGHLHRLFRAEGITVGALIRRSRLERARAELADPLWAGEHIHTIAARWGMAAAEFSRAFRAVYGMTPSEYRHQRAAGRAR